LGDAGAVEFYLGLDGLNVWLIVLTAVLLFSSVLVSWKGIEERANEYYAWLLLLGTAMFGVFLAFDIILFYVFFELTLVPLFFLIGIWSGPERRHAARKFFILHAAGRHGPPAGRAGRRHPHAAAPEAGRGTGGQGAGPRT